MMSSLIRAYVALCSFVGKNPSFDRDPARLRKAVEAGAAEVTRLAFRVASLEQQLDRSATSLVELGAAHAAEVTRLTSRVASLEQQLDAFHASTSWRITRPLRLIKTAAIRRNGSALP